MRKSFKKFISLFILAVFLLAITPEELIHAFTGHSDTIDTLHSDRQLSIKHIHCGSLQLSLPSFTAAASIKFPFQLIELAQLASQVDLICDHSHSIFSFGRAPPFMT